jgi:hypothetical protein
MERRRFALEQTGGFADVQAQGAVELQADWSRTSTAGQDGKEAHPEAPYPVWSPHDAFAGAATLLRLLAEERAA